jgi:hypothetical protein
MAAKGTYSGSRCKGEYREEAHEAGVVDARNSRREPRMAADGPTK